MSKSILLTGLDGANPLAFLAALGVVSLLRDTGARMCWRFDRRWQPVLTHAPCRAAELARCLRARPALALGDFQALGPDITVEPAQFRQVVQAAQRAARNGDRSASDLAAAFGCEAIPDPKHNRIQYTGFCFITGSGHQHFLGAAAALDQAVTAGHIETTLFGPWEYQESKGKSFRWDPADAAEYALRWSDPSKDGASSVWGANWLAFQALPLLPTQPVRGSRLQTTAIASFRRQDPEFRWPLWTVPAGYEVIRSLVALAELQQATPDTSKLHAMGIEQVFRARCVRIGQGAKLKRSFRTAAAV